MDNEILTNVNMDWLGTKQVSTDIPRPVPNRKQNDSFLVDAKLSPETQAREIKRLASLNRKKTSLKEKKKRDRRYKPWTAKQATKRRKYKKLWATNPYSCVIRGYGAYELSKADWDKVIAPLWEQYDPENLKVKRYKGYGFRDKPLTIYSIDIVHATRGVVYSGSSQQIYDLSSLGS